MYVRVSKALILQSPSAIQPDWFKLSSIRLILVRYNLSSAGSKETTSVARGIPFGSNAPTIVLNCGRFELSGFSPNCISPSEERNDSQKAQSITPYCPYCVFFQPVGFYGFIIQFLFYFMPVFRKAQGISTNNHHSRQFHLKALFLEPKPDSVYESINDI